MDMFAWPCSTHLNICCASFGFSPMSVKISQIGQVLITALCVVLCISIHSTLSIGCKIITSALWCTVETDFPGVGFRRGRISRLFSVQHRGPPWKITMG